MDLIRESPQRFPAVLRSIRRVALKRFPYGVYFEVQDDRIVVLAVYHFKRSPDGRASRI
jgi:toxin ParE1/3/4